MNQYKIFAGLGILAFWGGLAGWEAHKAHDSTPYRTEEFDFNGDGRKDIVVYNKKGHPEDIFIKRKDGTYEKGCFLAEDGGPFVETKFALHDTWGHKFEVPTDATSVLKEIVD